MKVRQFLSLLTLPILCGASLRSRQILEKIAGYQPTTTVTDYNAIAYDQKEIETLLVLDDEEAFTYAKNVYSSGYASKSYAEINIEDGLPFDVPVGTLFVGTAVNGNVVTGEAIKDYAQGDITIRVEYAVSDVQESYVGCRVGGSPYPVTAGCLVGQGNVTVDGKPDPLVYTYHLNINNDNGRTIKGFTSKAGLRFHPNDNTNIDFYHDMQMAVNYYGHADFADKIIEAAFDGTAAEFEKGTLDFSVYDKIGRTEVIEKATAYIAIGMFAIRHLEVALTQCGTPDAPGEVDRAVALYTGALQSEDGTGNLFYSLAEKRCRDFKTCGHRGKDSSGTSKVNLEIFEEFRQMQENLQNNRCPDAKANKERIAHLYYVPLIQGTLRYAYMTSQSEVWSEKEEAEGAVFAAAVLPVVNFCSPEDAKLIYENMKPGQDIKTIFRDVKQAFENNYDCMQVTCNDVGGIWDNDKKSYKSGARPCGYEEEADDDRSPGRSFGITLVSLTMVAAGVAAVWSVSRRRRRVPTTELKVPEGTSA